MEDWQYMLLVIDDGDLEFYDGELVLLCVSTNRLRRGPLKKRIDGLRAAN